MLSKVKIIFKAIVETPQKPTDGAIIVRPRMFTDQVNSLLLFNF